MAMRTILLLVAAVILGLTGGFAWSRLSKPSAAATAANAPAFPSAKPGQTSREVEATEYYADCDAAKSAGKQPLYTGQPGYRLELDPDGDGVACPPQS